jgi:indole-3-glycerol phosphate synthase
MILDKIAASTRARVALHKSLTPFDEVQSRALALDKGASSFEASLRGNDIAFICEIKKASPSKGVIAEELPYLDIARDYERAGADAVSVLTEPEFFLGSDEFLKEIRTHIGLPILRKDFIVDEYQLYESKLLGADAVLLICALLDTETLRRYIAVCESLGLSALVEAHNEREILSALAAGARIVGVNNRNLRTFRVDLMNCVRLRPLVPDEILFVAESGIRTAEDVALLRGAKADAVLIGETLMRSADKKAALAELRGET